MARVVKHSPYSIGIDLGMSNSAIFLKGRAEVNPIEGRPLLPSVVNVRDTAEIVVGYAAKMESIKRTKIEAILASHAGTHRFAQALQRSESGTDLLRLLGRYIQFNAVF